jgi:hypothetical protein
MRPGAVAKLTKGELEDLYREHGSWIEAARATGWNVSSIRNYASQRGVRVRDLKAGPPAPTQGGQARHVTSDDPQEWGDIRRLLQERGLRPDDWVVIKARVNEWGGPDGQDNAQLRVELAPRMGLLLPARSDGWQAPPRPEPAPAEHELVAFLGDHHAPHHDERLHAAVCEWLREFKPARGIILGDLLDLDTLSRHRRTPEWTAEVQATLDAGYSILRAYIEASPGTRWEMLDGNHEERLRNSVLDHLSTMFGVRRAREEEQPEEQPVLSTPYLLRLDELGVEWHPAGSSYEHAQINVTSELAARHGWIAKKGSGASALTTIDHLRYSVVIGHTHRQAIVHHTAHSIDGQPKTLLGCEAGTLANIEGGLGYANAPDWQQGFAVADVYSGTPGLFKVDLATYVDGTLLWRDWICRP